MGINGLHDSCVYKGELSLEQYVQLMPHAKRVLCVSLIIDVWGALNAGFSSSFALNEWLCKRLVNVYAPWVAAGVQLVFVLDNTETHPTNMTAVARSRRPSRGATACTCTCTSR
jgi:hypothetical protein